MQEEKLADTFEAFVVDELLRNASAPYDVMTVEALRSTGPLGIADHWVLSPSLSLGGAEIIENLSTNPAATAMIFAGDIRTAVEAASHEAQAKAIVPWTDHAGRARLRLDFG